MQTDCKIMLVGVGNIGQSLVKGWLNNGVQAKDIVAIDPSGSADVFCAEKGIRSFQTPEKFTGSVDIVVFAVKPQLMPEVVPLYQFLVSTNPVFVSIAAGVDVPRLKGFLGGDASVVRAMPNVPTAIGLGISGLYAEKNVTQEHKNKAEELLNAVGEVVWVESEDQLDTVTALSGSGPAYFFCMIEALAKAGIAQGLSEEVAVKLASVTAFGSGAVAVEECQTNALVETVEQLTENMTSIKGTTYAGVEVLSEAGFHEMVLKAVIAARKRAYELRNS